MAASHVPSVQRVEVQTAAGAATTSPRLQRSWALAGTAETDGCKALAVPRGSGQPYAASHEVGMEAKGSSYFMVPNAHIVLLIDFTCTSLGVGKMWKYSVEEQLLE